MRKATFYCLRYFVLPSQNLFQSQLADTAKRAAFEEALFKQQDFTTKRDVLYTVTGITRQEVYVFGKIGRRKTTRIPERTEDDIEEVPREEWPYLSFVCDIQNQLIAIEAKSTVISDADEMGRLLKEIVDGQLFTQGLTAHFDPIVDPNAFWDFVHSLEGVYQLEFTLSAPNIFGAAVKANEALKEMKEHYNITRVRTSLENEAGKLDLETRREEIDSYREYVDKGGGRWRVKGQQPSGAKITKKSSDRVVKHEASVEESPTREELVQIIILFVNGLR